MKVALKAKWKKFVDDRVASKQYKNADAVLEEALKLMRKREEEEAEELESLRRSLRVASDQIDRGNYLLGSEVTVDLIRSRAIKRLGSPSRRKTG